MRNKIVTTTTETDGISNLEGKHTRCETKPKIKTYEENTSNSALQFRSQNEAEIANAKANKR